MQKQTECDCIELVLGNYSQERFPEDIKHMRSLKTLKVYLGKLKYLPENIGIDHPRLVDVMIAGTKLKSIPSSISKVKTLTSIRMFSNEIETIPDEIGDLTNLNHLFLDHNNIKKLPESLSKLENLLQLSVTDNKPLTKIL